MELRTKNCPLADSVQGRRFPEPTERILLVEHQEEAKKFRLFSNRQLKKATEADISNEQRRQRGKKIEERRQKGDKILPFESATKPFSTSSSWWRAFLLLAISLPITASL